MEQDGMQEYHNKCNVCGKEGGSGGKGMEGRREEFPLLPGRRRRSGSVDFQQTSPREGSNVLLEQVTGIQAYSSRAGVSCYAGMVREREQEGTGRAARKGSTGRACTGMAGMVLCFHGRHVT